MEVADTSANLVTVQQVTRCHISDDYKIMGVRVQKVCYLTRNTVWRKVP